MFSILIIPHLHSPMLIPFTENPVGSIGLGASLKKKGS